MNTDNLTSGMKVVIRENNKEYIVIRDTSMKYARTKCDLLMSDDGWLSLNEYRQDLTDKDNFTKFDIMAVYIPKTPKSLIRPYISDKSYWECIWERGEPATEMTLREIEEKLGIKNLKIVKE